MITLLKCPLAAAVLLAALSAGSPPAQSSPLPASPTKSAGAHRSSGGADDAADLLRAAQDVRETWPKSFPGFVAQVHIEQDSKVGDGSLIVSSDGKVDLAMADPDLKKAATSALGSMVSHRFGGVSHDNPSLAPTDVHPQGRAILLNDSGQSLYRIRDSQILQVNRTMGDLKFTIDVLKNRMVEGGKYLPSFFTVTYRDAKTGALQKTETFEESYTKVGAYYLPDGRRMVSAGASGTSVTTMVISGHRLAGAAAVTK